jgi:HEAT repeat protein
MHLTTRQLLLLFIAATSLLILLFIAVTILRRIVNARLHEKLDRLREGYRRQVAEDLSTGTLRDRTDSYRTRPGSLAWQAVEEVLFEQMNSARHRPFIADLFRSLGYVDRYEKRLDRRNPIVRAAAADRLGRMQSTASAPRLAALLKLDNDEIVSVAMRSLARLNTDEALELVLENLGRLVNALIVSRKTVQAVLEQFNTASPDLFLRYGRSYADSPQVTAFLLGALASLQQNEAVVAYAARHLASADAEVRAKALRLLGAAGAPSRGLSVDAEAVVPLLRDPLWFVRFQAVRALQNIGHAPAARPVGALLFDENWQVRNAAAAALTSLGPAALDVLLDALGLNDRYAKESICEEMVRTHFTDRLFTYLDGNNASLAEKAVTILTTMHRLRFSTSIEEFLRTAQAGRARDAAGRILSGEAPA